MNKKLVRKIRKLAIGGTVYMVALFYADLLPPALSWLKLLFFLAAYAIIGGDVARKAVANIFRGQVFDENFLMTIATVGAFFVGDYSEAVAVMLFYQVGECFENYAVGHSRRSIAELMDIRPDYANVLRKDTILTVNPEEVAVGETILVKPGEKIPLDGMVLKGDSFLDTAALTGESLPREVGTGDRVISGCVNQNGLLEIQVEKAFGQSTVAKILDLVENAGSKKAAAENFITKFARYYTPIVVISALLLAVLPPLLLGGGFQTWIYRALTFLVISCPCALVISIPLSFFGGLGGASRAGILIKGSNYLEALSNAETIVMDKTGTLTKGNFAVAGIFPAAVNYPAANAFPFSTTDVSPATDTFSAADVFPTAAASSAADAFSTATASSAALSAEEILLETAAYAESYSTHPISQSLLTAYGREIDGRRLTAAEEIAGHGIRVVLDGVSVYVGNDKLMHRQGIPVPAVATVGTVVHVAREKDYLGYLVIADEIKPDAREAVALLKAAGITRIAMLTGDSKRVADFVAEQVGIDEVYAELLPGDKVEKVEELLQHKDHQAKDHQAKDHQDKDHHHKGHQHKDHQDKRSARRAKAKLIFVGDGINDAPVLARADIGIAMGGLGSDAAIEAADIVIMTDEPIKLAAAMRISRKTLTVVRQNIVFALGVKIGVLLLAAAGMATMWAAVFADVGVAVIAILNAMRVLKAGR